MRLLGLDLGTKTLGISMSDKTKTIVNPYKVLRFKSEDYDTALNEVLKIVKELEVDTVILGLPKNMDGSIGFAGKRSLNFAEMLRQKNIQVILEDERLTTVNAEGIVHQNNDNIKRAKKKIDSIAASLILESYIRKCQNDFTK